MNFCEQVSKVRYWGKRGYYIPPYHWEVIDKAIHDGVISTPTEYFRLMFLNKRSEQSFKHWR